MRRFLVATVVTVAMAFAPSALAHHLTITGTPACQENAGTYTLHWTVVNSQGASNVATVTASNRPVVPVGAQIATSIAATEIVPGNSTSVTLTLSSRWQNGVTGTASGTIQMPGTCTPPDTTPPPPPPKTCKTNPGMERCAVRRPMAHFNGPCGDPYYTATLNNRKSNRAVTFNVRAGSLRFSVRVRAHSRVTTRPFYVLGFSPMRIGALGRTLDYQKAAAPGHYPWTACA